MSTPTRTIRIEDDLWREAGDAVKQNGGESITEVIRDALQQYVADTARQAPRVAKLAAALAHQYPAEPMVELVRIIRAGLETLEPNDDGDIMAYASGWLESRRP
jgi:metal-responsive CopG/Arc/MetJ family transcriptional regulator